MSVETNSLNEFDNNDLIDSFLKLNQEKFFDIIVDIGCGTGNVTKILSEKIPHKQILAFDIDSASIETAKKDFGSDSIQYLTEDITKPWDQIIPELKALESKVSLIFSNYVFHYFEDKETAVKNIKKLLKDSGSICINIEGILEVIPQLRPQLQQKFVEVPDRQKQYIIWKKLLSNNGIALSYCHITRLDRMFDRDLINCLAPLIPQVYKIYVKSKIPEEREKVVSDPELEQMASNVWFKEYEMDLQPDTYRKFIESDKKGLICSSTHFRFFGNKLC